MDVAAERGAKRVRRMRKEMGRQVAEGAKWARHRGDDLADRLSPDELTGEVRKYLGEARERISDAVETELRDLRRELRRRRRKLGV